MQSFINDNIHEKDIVVYLKNTRTGSSTVRKCKFIGLVTGFTKSKVKIVQLSKEDQWVYPDECRYYGEVEVCPNDIICTMWRSTDNWEEVKCIGENTNC